MLALGIRYLNGFIAASEHHSHETVEWPPHPGRVFMALAAAYFETHGDLAERDALVWLEQLEPPLLRASNCTARAVVTHYVPVNEFHKTSKALLLHLPLPRGRQQRTFTRAWLDDDKVFLIWPERKPPEEILLTIARLCDKVSRIGHSTSLVQMWIAQSAEVGSPNWLPSANGANVYLRVAGSGTLNALQLQYNHRIIDEFNDLKIAEQDDAGPLGQIAARRTLQENFRNGPPTRSRPTLSMYQGYVKATAVGPQTETQRSIFSHVPLVFTLQRVDGPFRQLGLVAFPMLVQRWRDAILRHSDGLPQLLHQLLSGHFADGSPLNRPHVAFLPLAYVGSELADGHILGIGIAIPFDISPEDRRLLMLAIGRVRQLELGPLGTWNLAVETRDFPPSNIHPRALTAYPGGATRWSSVTPIAFDRHARGRDTEQEVVQTIATACTRIGLPRPREVIASHISPHLGVPPAFRFPRLLRKDGSQRRHTHATIEFDSPVCGPLIIGAGRFRGYGICRPLVREVRG